MADKRGQGEPRVSASVPGRQRGLCLYHKNCADGFAAALAVWLTYGDGWDYRAVDFGEDPPSVVGREVLIVDFAYPRLQTEGMFQQAQRLTVIDHHKTAAQALSGLPYGRFDLTKSGAVLTWEYLFPQRAVPLLFQYVQDRDLWRWQLAHSREINAALRLQPQTFATWQAFLDDTRLLALLPLGQAVVQYQDHYIQAVTTGPVGTVDLAGYRVPCVNCTHLLSEIVGALAEQAPFAVGYFDRGDRRIFCLRSRPKGVDVAAIAQQFGGGGHAQAAGFWRPRPGVMDQGG